MIIKSINVSLTPFDVENLQIKVDVYNEHPNENNSVHIKKLVPFSLLGRNKEILDWEFDLIKEAFKNHLNDTFFKSIEEYIIKSLK